MKYQPIENYSMAGDLNTETLDGCANTYREPDGLTGGEGTFFMKRKNHQGQKKIPGDTRDPMIYKDGYNSFCMIQAIISMEVKNSR